VTRPPFEVADIIRAHGDRFVETHQAWLTALHRRVLRALARCRTAALGGHLDQCAACAHRAISYTSCRNRHCPKCLTRARDAWLAERQRELLPVGYAHVVFTLPHTLSWLALQNKRVVYDLLFRASATTLLEVARTPRHLGASIGFLSVLHTWGQTLLHHPHVHCVVPAGGLSPDGRVARSPIQMMAACAGNASSCMIAIHATPTRLLTRWRPPVSRRFGCHLGRPISTRTRNAS
jgi:hypothetical protein